MTYQDPNRTAAVIEQWRTRHNLTPAEVAIVRLAVDESGSRTFIAARRGVAESTVKKQIQVICTKTKCRGLSDIIVRILREVVYGQAAA